MRHHIGLSLAKPREAIVETYKRLRSVGIRLNSTLVDRLTKEMLEEGARKLGILVDGVLVFDSEDESSILMDYCLYHVERKGRNSIEQYLIESPPDADSDEMTCLRAMQYAKYTLIIVESIEPGFGINVFDLLTESRYTIVDMGLSQSGVPGLILATRVEFLDDFNMTGGAAVPLGALPLDKRRELSEFARCARGLLTPDARGNVDPALLLRTRLESDSFPRMRYEDPSANLGAINRSMQSSMADPERLVGSDRLPRNALCPCGSGKKYKHCCRNR